jgi:class 3 adenylate cyclase
LSLTFQKKFLSILEQDTSTTTRSEQKKMATVADLQASTRDTGSVVSAAAAEVSSTGQLFSNREDNVLYFALTESIPLLPLVRSLHTCAATPHKVVTLGTVLLLFLQQLGYLMNPSIRWGYLIDPEVAQVTWFTHLPFWDTAFIAGTSETAIHIMLWSLFAMCGFIFAVAALNRVQGNMASQNAHNSSMLTLFAASVAQFLSTIGFVPACHVIAAAVMCKSATEHAAFPATVTCGGGSHTSMIIGAVLTAPLLGAIVLCFACCDYASTSNGATVGIGARQHSRTDQLLALHTVFSVAIYHALMPFGYTAAYLVLFSIATAVVGGAYCLYLPYFNHKMNRLHAALFLTTASIGATALVAALLPAFARSRGPSMLIVGLGPAAFLFFVLATDVRLSSAFAYRIHLAFNGVASASQDDPVSVSLSGLYDAPHLFEIDVEAAARHVQEMLEADAFFGDDASSGDDEDEDEQGNKDGDGSPLVTKAGSLPCIGAAPLLTRVIVPEDVGLATRFVSAYTTRMVFPPEAHTIGCAMNMYNQGMARFFNDAVVITDFAGFIVAFHPVLSSAALTSLHRVESMNTSIDTLYRADTLFLQIRYLMGARDQQHERLATQAQEQHRDALMQLNKFWTKLMEPSVDIAQASDIADQFIATREMALENFRTSLVNRKEIDAAFSDSVGRFMSEVMLDPEATLECEVISNELKTPNKNKNQQQQQQSFRSGTSRLTETEMSVLIGRLLTAMHARKLQVKSAGSLRLVPIVVVTFFLLTLVAVAMIVVSVTIQTVDDAVIDRSVAASAVRVLPQQFLYQMYQYTNDPTAANAADYLARMQLTLQNYTLALQAVVGNGVGTSDMYSSSHMAQAQMLLQRVTGVAPVADAAMVGNHVTTDFATTSEWAAGAALATSFQTALRVLNATLSSGTIPATTEVSVALDSVRLSVPQTVAEFFSRELVNVQLERESITATLTNICIAIVVVGQIVTVLALSAFMLVFHQVTLTKLFTFQLFTLIPFDSLEILGSTATDQANATELKLTARRNPVALINQAIQQQEAVRRASVTPAGGLVDDEEADARKLSQSRETLAISGAEDRTKSVGRQSVMESVLMDGGMRAASVSDTDVAEQIVHTDAQGKAIRWKKMITRWERTKKEVRSALAKDEGNRIRVDDRGDVIKRKVTIDTAVQVVLAADGDAAASKQHQQAEDARAAAKRQQIENSTSVTEMTTAELDAAAIDADLQWRNRQPGLVTSMSETSVSGESLFSTTAATVKAEKSVLRVPTAIMLLAVFALCVVSTALIGDRVVSTANLKTDMLDFERSVAAFDSTGAFVREQQLSVRTFVEGSGSKFKAYETYARFQSRCGVPLVFEPLFNVSMSTADAAVLQLAVSAYDQTLMHYERAVGVAEIAHGTAFANRQLAVTGVAQALEQVVSPSQFIKDMATYSRALVLSGATEFPAGARPALQVCARQLLDADALFAVEDELTERFVELQRRVIDRQRGALESQSRHGPLLAAAWCQVVAIIVTVLCLPSALKALKSRLLRSVHVFFIAYSLVVCVLLWQSYDADESLERAVADSVLAGETAFIGATQRGHATLLARRYASTGNAREWHAYHAAVANRKIFTEKAVLQRVDWDQAQRYGAYEALSKASATFQKVRAIIDIGHAVTMNANEGPAYVQLNWTTGETAQPYVAIVRNTVPLSSEMTTFRDAQAWSAVQEPTHEFDRTTFSPSAAYTTSALDTLASKNATHLAAIAREAVTGPRFTHYLRASTDSSKLLTNDVTVEARKTFDEVEGSLSTLSQVTFAMCLLGLCVASIVLFASYKLLRSAFIVDVMDDDSDQALAKMQNTPFYRRAFSETVSAVALISILLFACLGLGLWAVNRNVQSTTTLEIAGQREFLYAQVFGRIQEHREHAATNLSATDNTDTRACALHAVEAVSSIASDLWLIASEDASRSNSELNFGRLETAAAMAVADTHVTTQCGVEQAATTNANAGPFFRLATQPLEVAGPLWLSLAREYVDATTTVTRKATIMVALSANIEDVMDTLKQSRLEFAVSGHANVATAIMGLQTMVGITFAVFGAVFLFVFLPLSRRVEEEKQNTTNLLKIVPIEVRDQVPAIGEFLETGTMDTAAEIRRKIEMNENLLKNILPQEISMRLKSGESPIADMHHNITILFTDFVGFTKISSGKTAEQIVDFLNEVFVEFDMIAEILELNKIKTIGDAYFLAGGLDHKIKDHAIRMIDASFFMFKALDDHNGRHLDRDPLRMRLGIHSGPAVAGVIGTKKVAYDLWGASVVIANAMESTGEPQCIHVSSTTLSMAHGYFEVVPRGELPKEKGVPNEMPETFLVIGRLIPTPYQHITLPRLLRMKAVAKKTEQSSMRRSSSVVGAEAAAAAAVASAAAVDASAAVEAADTPQ